MKAVFVELPPFARHRQDYLDDEGFRQLQAALMANPEAGDVIEGTGGLRKVRHADARRGKGKRGGMEFWLFTLYDKDEADDLTARERKLLKELLKREVEARSKT